MFSFCEELPPNITRIKSESIATLTEFNLFADV